MSVPVTLYTAHKKQSMGGGGEGSCSPTACMKYDQWVYRDFKI